MPDVLVQPGYQVGHERDQHHVTRGEPGRHRRTSGPKDIGEGSRLAYEATTARDRICQVIGFVNITASICTGQAISSSAHTKR